MECPHCGQTSDEVIDSRPIKEGLAIRRRRRCLTCQGRFTTYESTEEQLPVVLMKRGLGQRGAMTQVKTVLAFTSRTLNAVIDEVGHLIEKADKAEHLDRANMTQKKGRPGIQGKKKEASKALSLHQAPTSTATDRVLRIIRRHKRGVDIAKLKARTGFDESKIGNILYRAHKEGKIRRVSRGIYAAAK
jgi:hypothetical protein